MNIEQIETFLDLCDTRSFNQTAERLGVTQSTISGRVRALETALNCRLLERSRAGTALTTEGLRFEPHARAMRLAWRDGVQDARGAGSAARTARIGIQHDLLGDSVADWVTVLQERDAADRALR
jgi:DNA-binding transcriptional LysR family regulator